MTSHLDKEHRNTEWQKPDAIIVCSTDEDYLTWRGRLTKYRPFINDIFPAIGKGDDPIIAAERLCRSEWVWFTVPGFHVREQWRFWARVSRLSTWADIVGWKEPGSADLSKSCLFIRREILAYPRISADAGKIGLLNLDFGPPTACDVDATYDGLV